MLAKFVENLPFIFVLILMSVLVGFLSGLLAYDLRSEELLSSYRTIAEQCGLIVTPEPSPAPELDGEL